MMTDHKSYMYVSLRPRWHAKSFYIYGCSPEQIPEGSGLSCNGASGITVTFKKRGGISNSWALAKQVATKEESS